MIGAIIGGAAIFAVSEIFGEVYHSWNCTSDKNILIKTGRKLADCSESVEESAANLKNKVTTKKNYNKACNVKQLASSPESLDEALKALDKQLENISKEKTADALAVEANLVDSVVKVCDSIIKENKLTKKDNENLEAIKAQGVDLSKRLSNKEITNQNSAKKMIKDYVKLVQPYIEKITDEKNPSRDKSGETNDGKKGPKFTTEETKIPDFTKNVSSLKISDIKETARENSNK